MSVNMQASLFWRACFKIGISMSINKSQKKINMLFPTWNYFTVLLKDFQNLLPKNRLIWRFIQTQPKTLSHNFHSNFVWMLLNSKIFKISSSLASVREERSLWIEFLAYETTVPKVKTLRLNFKPTLKSFISHSNTPNPNKWLEIAPSFFVPSDEFVL